jgi:hypothetical protein
LKPDPGGPPAESGFEPDYAVEDADKRKLQLKAQRVAVARRTLHFERRRTGS